MEHERLNGTEDAVEEPAFRRVLTAWQVADALDSLSPEHRAVIVELNFRHRSLADAARELEVPEGTVKSRAYFALRALRVACEERGVLPRPASTTGFPGPNDPPLTAPW